MDQTRLDTEQAGVRRTGPPIIGIATDIAEPKPGRIEARCTLKYAESVARAGGFPVFLPAVVKLIPAQLALCDGFVLTGGDDPRMEEFGEATHPKAEPMHEVRQWYDVALIRALLEHPEVPVLGICLGMQLLSLVSGGKMEQYLPERLETAAGHRGGNLHPVSPVGDTWLPPGPVASFHKQAVRDPGTLKVVAQSDDGVIEAVMRSGARFCLGVQWHPERTEDPALGDGVFARLVDAARAWARAHGRMDDFPRPTGPNTDESVRRTV